MSNPAVFELSKDKINQQEICIEDNIGEAIHLHIDSFRIDMTVKEFEAIAFKLEKSLEYLVPLKNFNLSNYDPFFLKKIAKNLPYLIKIEKKMISIENLKLKFENERQEIIEKKINETPVYFFYSTLKGNLECYEDENFIFQSNIEKAMYVYNFIFKKKINCKKNKICIDENGFILDGYKTVCALSKKYGIKKEVEVEVMYFENGNNPLIIKRRKKQLW